MKKLPLFFISLAFNMALTTPSYSFGTGEGGHRGLTRKALELKKALHANDDLGKELERPGTIEKIIACAIAEDEDGPKYNPNYLQLIVIKR